MTTTPPRVPPGVWVDFTTPKTTDFSQMTDDLIRAAILAFGGPLRPDEIDYDPDSWGTDADPETGALYLTGRMMRKPPPDPTPPTDSWEALTADLDREATQTGLNWVRDLADRAARLTTTGGTDD